jgi:hypothetical protein
MDYKELRKLIMKEKGYSSEEMDIVIDARITRLEGIPNEEAIIKLMAKECKIDYMPDAPEEVTYPLTKLSDLEIGKGANFVAMLVSKRATKEFVRKDGGTGTRSSGLLYNHGAYVQFVMWGNADIFESLVEGSTYKWIGMKVKEAYKQKGRPEAVFDNVSQVEDADPIDEKLEDVEKKSPRKKARPPVKIKDFEAALNLGVKSVNFVGYILGMDDKKAKNGAPLCFVTLADETGIVSALIYDDNIPPFKALMLQPPEGITIRALQIGKHGGKLAPSFGSYAKCWRHKKEDGELPDPTTIKSVAYRDLEVESEKGDVTSGIVARGPKEAGTYKGCPSCKRPIMDKIGEFTKCECGDQGTVRLLKKQDIILRKDNQLLTVALPTWKPYPPIKEGEFLIIKGRRKNIEDHTGGMKDFFSAWDISQFGIIPDKKANGVHDLVGEIHVMLTETPLLPAREIAKNLGEDLAKIDRMLAAMSLQEPVTIYTSKTNSTGEPLYKVIK